MESPRVEMISNSFVKPKFISKEAKKPVYLSPWDLAMMSTHYIQKGLLYALPKNQDFSITAFLDDLKDSLSATLTHFHPLAARLSTVKQQNPPSFSVFIDPNNSPGARFIHSSVNLTVADILTPTDVPLVVQSFFDHHKAISHEGHELSLLSVQSLFENTRLIFLTAPPVNEPQLLQVLGSDDHTNELRQKYADALEELCLDMGIKVINLCSVFKLHPDWEETFFIDGMHFSEHGSQVVAKEILLVLKQADWKPSLWWQDMPSEFA